MSVFKRKVLWLSLILLLLIMVVYGLYLSSHRKLPKASSVRETYTLAVTKPQPQDTTITHVYIGQAEAINHTEIVPYISGYIIDIAAQGGQKVKKGELLAVLKQDEYLANLAAADAAIFALKADFINAKIKYYRMKDSGDDAYSQQEMDDAKSAFLSAAGNLEKAKAEQFAAQTDFDYTYMRAPFDGILGNIEVSIGEYVSPQSKNLMKLVQYNPIRIVFSISDKEFLNNFESNKKNLLKVKARLANGEILPQDGQIKYTDNTINKDTNSLAVYAEFENSDNRLLPNAYVQILLEQEYNGVILIAKPQVIMKQDGDYIYTVLNGNLQLHKLHIFGENDNKFVVENNFAENEYIVEDIPEAQTIGEKVSYKIIDKALN